jgi:plastocyanin
VSKRNLVLAAVCGAAVVVPALAYGQAPATVEAQDNGPGAHVWAPAEVTVATGATVTFRNPQGNTFHRVTFPDGEQPACTNLPAYPAQNWEGSCRFDTAGTYRFVCPVHAAQHMEGTITVLAPAPTATPAPAPQPAGSAPITQTTLTVALARAQKGTRVRGAVDVELAGSRLEVAVWTPRSAVVGGRSAKPLRIGRRTVASTPAGKVSFAVAINAKAKRALHRHGRLSVTVSVALTPPGGHKLTRSAKTTLRAG